MKKKKEKVVVGLIKKGSNVLLIKRKKADGKLKWAFPGGKVEKGENEKRAVQREILEETNISCKNLKKLGERRHPETDSSVSYWAGEHKEKRVKRGEDIEKAKWKPVKEALSLFTTNVYAPVKSYLKSLSLEGDDLSSPKKDKSEISSKKTTSSEDNKL